MASSNYTNNGKGTSSDHEEVREKLAAFFRGADAHDGKSTASPSPGGREGGGGQTESEEMLHGAKRHPEDPPHALKTGVGEHSLLDPDDQRVNAVDVGIAMQAASEEKFYPELEGEADGLLGIREGAVSGPALEQAGALAKTEATTERDVAQLVTEGAAATTKATQHEARVLPRLASEASKAAADYEKAVKDRDAFEDEARRNPTYWTDATAVEPTPVGGPLHWLALTAGRATLAFVVEILLGGFVLSGPVAETFVIDFPFGSVLVAMALSAVLVLVGALIGKALDATGLPVRIAAALFVVAGGFILWKATVSLDALREGEHDKAKVILTAATLGSVYAATLTSYAASVNAFFARRRQLIASIPTPTDLWRRCWERHESNVAEAKERRDQASAALKAGYEYAEERRAVAAGTDQRSCAREAAGIAAGVDFETLRSVAKVHLDQERSNRDAAVWAAKLAHTKARAEAYPVPESGSTFEAWQLAGGGLSPLVKGAIVALTAGAIGGLLGVKLILALGVVVAVILLLLALSGWVPSFSSRHVRSAPPEKVPPPVSTLAGNEETPGWKVPPRSTRPKYSTAPNDPARRH
jgi:hypothetical protein